LPKKDGKQMKTTILLIAIALALGAQTAATAQEVRRAVPMAPDYSVDKWRSLPRETTWGWLSRTGMCTAGDCEGGHGGTAYMNWGDAIPPVYDNIEIEPEEVLLAPYAIAGPATFR
jgi:hypothetical protein